MKILLLHNYYQQAGGEDEVLRTELDLLSSAGHEVRVYSRHNDELKSRSRLSNITLPLETLWSFRSASELSSVLRDFRPDIAHFHNTFPLISPSAYYECRRQGVPVVQTLQNFRLLCPSATLFRKGEVCELCVGKTFPISAIRHKCYRNNMLGTGVVGSMLAFHRLFGTYSDLIDSFIAVNQFSRRKFIEGGLPGDKIFVKPNSAVGPSLFETPRATDRNYALFLGRFCEEKGLRTLVKAVNSFLPDIQLRLVGDGPLRDFVNAQLKSVPNVLVDGWRSHEEALALLRRARLLIVPSIWYEGFPVVSLEAFAAGVPVLASKLGAFEEAIQHDVTGFHFRPGDPDDLASGLNSVWHDTDRLDRVARQARRAFDERYSPALNYQALISIYEETIRRVRSRKMDPHEVANNGAQ